MEAQLPESLGGVFNSLLSSMLKAQVQSAQATWDLIQSVGLDENNKPLMIPFKYEKADGKTHEAQIPLLSLINLPTLGISKATYTFSYEVSSIQESKEVTSSSLPVRALDRPLIFEIKGGIKKKPIIIKSDQQESNSKYEKGYVFVDITIEPTPLMAIGIEKIRDILDLATLVNTDQ